MRKAALAIPFVLGLLAAGGLSAGVVAATTSTSTTTPQLIAPGVTISGVDVGNFTEGEAYQAVSESFARPLSLAVPRHRLAPAPAKIGAMAAVRAAVKRALAAPAGTELKLRVILNRRGTNRYLDAVAKRFDRKPVDSKLFLSGLRPRVTKPQAGRALRRTRAMDAIFTALVTNTRLAIVPATTAVARLNSLDMKVSFKAVDD